MRRVIFLITSSAILLCATPKSNFKHDCIGCHADLPITLYGIYKRYLMVFSSKKDIKSSLVEFLQKPSRDNSVMSDRFLRRYGLKYPTTLSPKRLRGDIDYFIEHFDIKKRLY